MLKRKTNLILSFLLFAVCLAIGFRLAYDKPLWNDELYTLISSVRGLSYGDIFLGRVGEGSNCPLFYLIQKSICDIAQYTVPEPWISGVWGHEDLYSQILIRISPVVCMALAIVLIFYFFNRQYSLWAGVYSVAVSLSSFMIWFYWAEARPYALWVLLTTMQLLMFLRMTGEGRKNGWVKLSIIHILLSLSVTVSIIQIAIVSLLLWIFFDRRWKKYILLFVIPSAICLTYYALAPKYDFWFKEGPWALINASFSKDRLLILFIFALYFCFTYFRSKVTLLRKVPVNIMSENERKQVGAYLGLTVLMVLGSLLLLLRFKLGVGPVKQGFQISNRYFISLAPIGIVATTLFSIYLVKGVRGRLMQGLVLLFLAGLLLIRIYRTALLI